MKKYLYAGLLLFTACAFDSPKAPSWDLTLNIPLTDKLYTVREMAESEEDIFVLEEGMIGFRLRGDLEQTKIGDFLTLSENSTEYGIGLAKMHLPAISGGVDNFSFDQLYENARRDHDQIVVVPQFSYRNVRGSTLEDSDFDFVALTAGTAELTVTNSLPVPLVRVALVLIDANTDAGLVSAPIIAKIDAGDSATVTVNLDGKVLPAASYWTLSGESPGSGSEAVRIDQSADVRLSTEIQAFNISKAHSVIPEMQFDHMESLVLEEDAGIEEVAFKNGFLEWNVENTFPLVIDLDFNIESFKHSATGETLVRSVRLGPGEAKTLRVDLDKYIAYLVAASPNTGQTVPVTISGASVGSEGKKVNINAYHQISGQVFFSETEVDYFKGWVNNRGIDLASTDKKMDLPARTDDLKDVEFKSALLNIDLENTIQMPFTFESEITGYRDGETVTFFVNDRITPVRGDGQPDVARIQYDQSNSTILNFVNLLPERYTTKSRVRIGDGQTVAYVDADQYVQADFAFTVPAEVKFKRQTIVLDTSKILVDPEGMPVDNSNQRRVPAETSEKLATAEIMARVNNHLPVGCQLFFHLGYDSTRIVDFPQVVLGPIEIVAGKTNMQGRVIGSSEQEVILKISEDGIEIFSNNTRGPIPVYIATVLKIPESPHTVQVFADDFIQTVSLARIIVKMENENS